MTIQHETHDGKLRTPAIPHTIDAISQALSPAKRMAFYAEVGQAEEGEPVARVMRKWWMEATFDSRPGRQQQLDDAAAGRNLTPLPDPVGGEG